MKAPSRRVNGRGRGPNLTGGPNMSTVATEIEATEAAELAESAYLEVIRRSPLGPREHFDALLGALISAHPEASVAEMANWLSGAAR